MHLSDIGKYAHQYWQDIPIHFPFVQLGEFVLMPNHMHGIIIIDKPDTATAAATTAENNSPPSRTAAASAKWKPGTLGVIINQYKRAVTIAARKIDPGFGWQARFHDHIIRNNASFQRISHYIKTNPANWSRDKFRNISHP